MIYVKKSLIFKKNYTFIYELKNTKRSTTTRNRIAITEIATHATLQNIVVRLENLIW